MKTLNLTVLKKSKIMKTATTCHLHLGLLLYAHSPTG